MRVLGWAERGWRSLTGTDNRSSRVTQDHTHTNIRYIYPWAQTYTHMYVYCQQTYAQTYMLIVQLEFDILQNVKSRRERMWDYMRRERGERGEAVSGPWHFRHMGGLRRDEGMNRESVREMERRRNRGGRRCIQLFVHPSFAVMSPCLALWSIANASSNFSKV